MCIVLGATTSYYDTRQTCFTEGSVYGFPVIRLDTPKSLPGTITRICPVFMHKDIYLISAFGRLTHLPLLVRLSATAGLIVVWVQ